MFPTSERATNITTLVKLISKILMISHAFSCIWIWLARYEISNNEPNWIEAKDYTLFEWYNQYLLSYYFIMVTMITVGYGDVTPVGNKERLLCICTMLATCGVFAYAVNSIDGLLKDIYQYEQDIKKNMKIINKYMIKKNISNNLQYHIRQYLDYVWRESSEDSEQEGIIIEQLSDILKEKLLIEANKIVLIDSPVFHKNFSQELIQKTVRLISEYKSTPEEGLLQKGEFDDCAIYFIEKGKVEIYLKTFPENETQKFQSIKVLEKGESFGLYSFFTGQPRNFDIRSTEFTSLLMIRRKDFLNLLQDFPDDYEKFCYMRDSVQFMNAQEIVGVKCFSCNSYQHQIDRCPYIHYNPPHMSIIQRFNYYMPNDRNQFDRLDTLKFGTIKENVRVLSRMKDFHKDFEQILDIYEDEWGMVELIEDYEKISDQNSNQSNIIEEKSNESYSTQQQLSNGDKVKDNSSNSNQDQISSLDEEDINENKENSQKGNNQSLDKKLTNMKQNLNNQQQNNSNTYNNNSNNSQNYIKIDENKQDPNDLSSNYQIEDQKQNQIAVQDQCFSENNIKRNYQLSSMKEDLPTINFIGNQSSLQTKQRISLSTNLLQIDEDDSQRSSDDTPNMYYQKNLQNHYKKSNSIINVNNRIKPFVLDNSKNSVVHLNESSQLSSEEEEDEEEDQGQDQYQEIGLEELHLNNSLSHEYKQGQSEYESRENKNKVNSKITTPEKQKTNFINGNTDFYNSNDSNPINRQMQQQSQSESQSQSNTNQISSQNKRNMHQTYRPTHNTKLYQSDAESEYSNSVSDKHNNIKSSASQQSNNQQFFPSSIQQQKYNIYEGVSEGQNGEDSFSQQSNKEYQLKENGFKTFKKGSQKQQNIVLDDQLCNDLSLDDESHKNNNRKQQICSNSPYSQQQQQQAQTEYGNQDFSNKVTVLQSLDFMMNKPCETMEKIVERSSLFDQEQKISAEIDCFEKENLLNLGDQSEINMSFTLEDEKDLYPKITVITEEEWNLNNIQKKLEQQLYQQEYEVARARDIESSLISQQIPIIEKEKVKTRNESPIPQIPKIIYNKRISSFENESQNPASIRNSTHNVNQEQQSKRESEKSSQSSDSISLQQQQQQQLISPQLRRQKKEIKQELHTKKIISSPMMSGMEDKEEISSSKLSTMASLNSLVQNQITNIIGDVQINQQSHQQGKNNQFSNLKLVVGNNDIGSFNYNNKNKNKNDIDYQSMKNQLKNSKSLNLDTMNYKQQKQSPKKKQKRDKNNALRNQIKSKTLNKEDILQDQQQQDEQRTQATSKEHVRPSRQSTGNLDNQIKKQIKQKKLKLENIQDNKQQQDSQSSNSQSSARKCINIQLPGQFNINSNNQGTITHTNSIGKKSNPNTPKHDPSSGNTSSNNRQYTEEKTNKMNSYRRPSMRTNSFLFKQSSGIDNSNYNSNSTMQINTLPENSPPLLLQVQQSGGTLQTEIPNYRRPSGMVQPLLVSQGAGIIGLSTAQKNLERRASVFSKIRKSILGNNCGSQMIPLNQQQGQVPQQKQNLISIQNRNSYTGQNYINPTNNLNQNNSSPMSPFIQQRKNIFFQNPNLYPSLQYQQQPTQKQAYQLQQQTQIPYQQQVSDNINLNNLNNTNNPQNIPINFDLHPSINPYDQQFQHNQDNEFMINFFDIMKDFNYYFKKNNSSFVIEQYNIYQCEIRVRREKREKEEKEKKKKLLGQIFKKKDRSVIPSSKNIKISRNTQSKNLTQSQQVSINPKSEICQTIQNQTHNNMMILSRQSNRSSAPILKSKLLESQQKQILSRFSQDQIQVIDAEEQIKYNSSNQGSHNTSLAYLNSNSGSLMNSSSNLICTSSNNDYKHVDQRLRRQDAKCSIFLQSDEQEIQQQQKKQDGYYQFNPSIQLLEVDKYELNEKSQVNDQNLVKNYNSSIEKLIPSQSDIIIQELP